MRCESQGIEHDDVDRSCGFLTKTEREYLLGEWQGRDDQQEKSKENEIAVRTRHALADFALLQKHGSNGFTDRIVQTDIDPPIFRTQVREHLIQGLLRFASDATTDESVTNYLFDELHRENAEGPDGVDSDDETQAMLEAAAQGNAEQFLTRHFRQFGEAAKDADISKREARRIFESAWPE
ncbi:hypothetical protein [Halapricum hydrolyticum]|uniref:Uncharacterized protein n=1 Tax=Halapricum hydrolyticum TaxID=2979991 RepID=A0AAE3IAF9_9EURY|nr:hypothetical protein [Halapricum hydrolyticum]MCU4718381.1 hypothetical protein [Halapricum hydrolyticum]MCU4726506.1 hypothetical protein [Halapricum hydrolyticum]